MSNHRIGHLIAIVTVTIFCSSTASAQVLWRALQTKPKPNMIVAYDVSTTMQIDPGCTGQCHAAWGGRPNAPWTVTRLQQATTEMLNTLSLFQSDFVYGGLRYDTCGPWGTYGSYSGGQWAGHCGCVGDCYDDDGGWSEPPLPSGQACESPGFRGQAEVSFMTPPNNTSPAAEANSYSYVRAMISDIATYPNTNNTLGSVNPNGITKFLACEHGESSQPGSSGSTGSVIPTSYPGGMPQFVRNVFTALTGGTGAIPGISISGVPAGLLSQTCDAGTTFAGQTVDSLLTGLTLSIATNGSCPPDATEIANVCAEVNTVYANLTLLAGNCFTVTAPVPPANTWLTTLPPPVCSPPGGANLCGNCGGGASGTVLHGTCACDNSLPGCTPVAGSNNCGLTWGSPPDRQVNAICAAGDSTPNAYPTFGNAGPCPGAGCTSIGNALWSQSDNVVHGGGLSTSCRENAVIFVTDGYGGAAGSVPNQANQIAYNAPAPAPNQAPQAPYSEKPFWSPANSASNAYVFRASVYAGFVPHADAMAVSLGQSAALPASDQVTLNTSFAAVLNRVEKGHYFASNLAEDPHETRLAVMSTSVPGHYTPGGVATYPDERYFASPTRISWYGINPTASPPTRSLICQTDWKSRAPISGVNVLKWDGTWATGVSNVSNAPLNLKKEYVTIGPPTGSADVVAKWLRPAGDPGTSTMYAEVFDDGTTDRGIVAPDGISVGVNPYRATGIPAAQTGGKFVYGYMLNGGSTQPVVVEAPHDVPVGMDAQFLKFEFDTTLGPASIPYRPRTIYSMAGGYLFAHNGGNYSAAQPVVNGVKLGSTYDDSNPQACTELFRFIPSWTDSAIHHCPSASCPGGIIDPTFPGDALRPAGTQFPDVLRPQSYTEGQIAVREARLHYTAGPTPPATDFGTILVMTQGFVGPWFSVLDVTNPYLPKVIGEHALPISPPALGNYTTGEPTIYEFPKGNSYQTVVVFTGGDGGDHKMFSFNIDRATGVTLLDQIDLPVLVGGESYPSSAVCFDGTNAGTVTHCVALSDAGRLAQVAINRADGRFIPSVGAMAADLKDGAGGYGPGYAIGATEKFYSHPAVFFETDGAVSFVFGSGDIKKINTIPAAQNYLYKVKETKFTSTGGSVNSTQVCTAVGGGPLTGGKIPLNNVPANEIITTSPVIGRGVVAFTTYTPPTSGCGSGSAKLYAMTYASCFDAAVSNSTARPAPAWTGNGIPMSPTISRTGDKLIVQTSSQEPAFVGVNGSGVGTKNTSRSQLVPLYWRPEVKSL